MRNLQVLPECYADTALVRLFIPDAQRVVHIFGIPNVAKEMQQAAVRNSPKVEIRIGIVDNDKRVPPYLLRFRTILEEDRVLLKRNEDTNQHLIVIDKAIESFLLWNAQQVDLAIADYGFSTDIRLFGKALKTSAIGADFDYLRLLNALHTQQAPGLLTLERILNDLTTT